MTELSGAEIQKHIGACEARVTRDGQPLLLVPKCRCKIVGQSADGPFQVFFCGKHQYLEDQIPWERETGRWKDSFLGQIAYPEGRVRVEFDGWAATITYDDKQGNSLKYPYPDIRKFSPEVSAENFATLAQIRVAGQ